ncbi:hypothetical protein K3172_14900 [Qipengyuania sp. 6B39]|uniref:hypothetical protein n=1 Tax=Qipengyuania proteolytica TaxID=2867239 RepID=UPI001C893B06|nr:hypothetical protein [Qipengyuania proteolytica]MBX7497145.1 hypothetical protein [Qipengyuania proteolytica]
MAEITAAIDETGANKLLDTVIALIPPQSASGSDNLGPFLASYSVTASLVNGDVDLIPPDIIRLEELRLNWSLSLSIGIDLSDILPDFCLPQVCVNIPCVGRVCTPRICIDWPTITVPVSFSDFVKADADFRLQTSLVSGNWEARAIIVGVPNLQFGLTTAALLAAIGLALTPILLAIPFIGPFLAIAANTILAAIGIAGLTGLLGPILTPFISGMQIPIYDQPRVFPVLPAQGAVDPQVDILIDAIAASVANSDGEDELVLTADISA